MFIRTGVHNWLNTDHIAQITWYPEEHEFIVKWTTGLSITVSEEPGVRALEETCEIPIDKLLSMRPPVGLS